MLLRTEPPLDSPLDITTLAAGIGPALSLPDRASEDAACPGVRDELRRIAALDAATLGEDESADLRALYFGEQERAHYAIAPLLGIPADRADDWFTAYDPGTDRFHTFPMKDNPV